MQSRRSRRFSGDAPEESDVAAAGEILAQRQVVEAGQRIATKLSFGTGWRCHIQSDQRHIGKARYGLEVPETLPAVQRGDTVHHGFEERK